MTRVIEHGDRERIAAAAMATAWRAAAADLGIRFVAPFAMDHRQQRYWCSGWLPDFGSPSGIIIADLHAVDEVLDVAAALGYATSGLSPRYYERYHRRLFIETLDDWGWFGDARAVPSWFSGRLGAHGG